jgi:hypothetical protein
MVSFLRSVGPTALEFGAPDRLPVARRVPAGAAATLVAGGREEYPPATSNFLTVAGYAKPQRPPNDMIKKIFRCMVPDLL